MSAPDPDCTAAVMRGCRSLALIVSNVTSAPSALEASGICRFSSTSDSGMKSTQRTQCSFVPCANAGAWRAARMPSIPPVATAPAAPETLMNFLRFISYPSIRESSSIDPTDMGPLKLPAWGLNLREIRRKSVEVIPPRGRGCQRPASPHCVTPGRELGGRRRLGEGEERGRRPAEREGEHHRHRADRERAQEEPRVRADPVVDEA